MCAFPFQVSLIKSFENISIVHKIFPGFFSSLLDNLTDSSSLFLCFIVSCSLFHAYSDENVYLIIAHTNSFRFLSTVMEKIIVCIGVSSSPLKNTTPSFLPSPLYIGKLSKPLVLGNSPLYWFLWPPLKSRIFQWAPKTLKFFILNTILSYKSN